MDQRDIQREQRKIFFDHLQRPTYHSLIDRAFTPKTRIGDIELDYLNSCFNDTIIIHPLQQQTSPHPIARVFTEFAEHIVGKQVNHTGSCIEIGPSVSQAREKFRRGYHACCLIKNSRDQARLLRGANFISSNSSISYNADETARGLPYFDRAVLEVASTNESTPFICTDGAENCDYPAKTAFSIHSIYDITPEKLHQIFERHGLTEMRAWCFHYGQALVVPEFKDPVNGFWHRRDYPSPGKITCGFSDSFGRSDNCLTYTHDYANLKFYLTHCFIPGKDFNIQFEIAQRHGPLVELRFSRTTMPNEPVTMSVRTNLEDYVLIPRLNELIAHNYRADKCKRRIVVNKQKFFTLVRYATSRSDTDVGFEKVTQYARSLMSEIMIGNKRVISRWDMAEEDYDDIVMFAYLYAMGIRFKRSKLVGEGVKRLQEELKSIHWWPRIKLAVSDRLKDLFDKFSSDSMIRGRLFDLTIDISSTIDITDEIGGHVYQGYEFADNRDLIDPYEALTSLCKELSLDCNEIDVISKDLRQYKEPKEEIQAIVKQIEQDVPARVVETPTAPPAEVESPVPPPISEIPAGQPIQPETIVEHSNEYLKRMHILRHPFNKMAKTLEATKENIEFPKMTIINGGPGTGKSTYVTKEVIKKKKNALIIVATREQKIEWKTRLADKPQYHVETQHKALTKCCTRYEAVVIDEAFLFSTPYLFSIVRFFKTPEVYFVGDPKQIGFIDFERMFDDQAKYQLTLFQDNIPQIKMNHCYRCPQDVVALLNKYFGYALHPVSEVKKSITEVSQSALIRKMRKKFDLHMVYRQVELNRQLLPDLVPRTIHQSQGLTRQKVVLELTRDAVPLIETSRQHLIVALTRHTKEFVFYSPTELGKFCVNDEHPTTQTVEIAAKIVPREVEHPLLSEVATSYVPEHRPPDANVLCFDPIPTSTIFAEALKNNNELYGNVTDTQMPNSDVEIRATKDAITATPIHKEIRRFPGQKFGVDYIAKDHVQALNTAIDRYCTLVKDLDSDRKDDFIKTSLERFDQLYLKHQPKIEQLHIDRAFKEFLEALKEKKHDKILTEYDVFMAQNNITDFMLKQQLKVKVKEAALQQGKAGQGIGAWSKANNARFCVWFRALEIAFTEALHDWVIFFNGWDESRFAQRMAAMIDDDSETVENDFAQYDQCHNEVLREVFYIFMTRAGVPEDIAREWLEKFKNRPMVHRGLFKIFVSQHQDSGQPATLLENTFYNMLILALIFIITDPKLLGFKGDDSILVARLIRLRRDAMKLLESLGFTSKMFKSTIPQFCAQFFTNHGFFPDIPSRALKLLGRQFEVENEQEFHDYKQAVKDWLKPLHVPEAEQAAVACATVYYQNSFQFTPVQVNQMLTFLRAFANLSYEQFKGYTVVEQIQYAHREYKPSPLTALRESLAVALPPPSEQEQEKPTEEKEEENEKNGKMNESEGYPLIHSPVGYSSSCNCLADSLARLRNLKLQQCLSPHLSLSQHTFREEPPLPPIPNLAARTRRHSLA